MPTGKRLAILQSNYVPWKGYFDLLASVDEFVVYDQVQYTKNDWRNRNRIKTPTGTSWLTIPIPGKGQLSRSIRETRVSNMDWAESHWRILDRSYAEAPAFGSVSGHVQRLYEEAASLELLSDINRLFIDGVAEMLGIRTPITASEDYRPEGDRIERLVSLCQAAGADTYVSGPAARAYLDPEPFIQAGIEVEWFDYGGYPEYTQLHGPFEHGVSILDTLFSLGTDAAEFVRGTHRTAATTYAATGGDHV